MGKSTELAAEREPAVDPSGELLIQRDLGEYGDETRLIRCVNLFGEQHTVFGEAALWWVYGDM